MLLVAGGQLDPNIGALLRQALRRGIDFKDVLVGPSLTPNFHLDVDKDALFLDGESIVPTACFVRHDVFLPQKTGDRSDHASALNWFYAIRGWAMSRPSVNIFNRHTYLSENNKIENLYIARQAGLHIPDTFISNDSNFHFDESVEWITKPVAGGEYTTLFRKNEWARTPSRHPLFIQKRLERPEFRIYLIGYNIFGFRIDSDSLDYRVKHDVILDTVDLPPKIGDSLISLCNTLGLDFAAADFMQDDKETWRFLEVNSQPMFAAFDRHVDGKISDSIIDFLCHGSNRKRSSPSLQDHLGEGHRKS
jgi:glutathione synthase/RimK-type ligase-like ATP-grasp enzyme